MSPERIYSGITLTNATHILITNQKYRMKTKIRFAYNIEASFPSIKFYYILVKSINFSFESRESNLS